MSEKLILTESTALFSFIRLCIQLKEVENRVREAALLRKGSDGYFERVPHQVFRRDAENRIAVEGLIDRDVFPDQYRVELVTDGGVYAEDCSVLVEEERQLHSRSSLAYFIDAMQEWSSRNPGARPKVLDIGGRARSGFLFASTLGHCDVTVLDIREDDGVDVVADIHEMGSLLPGESFDFIVCVSVFEHLLMPWKAALEINKVLKVGGTVFIQTHQTVGLHDRPWDYFRFSDDCWKGIFNQATGFEITTTFMTNFVRITPMHYYAIEKDGEKAGGFYESSVLGRKIGPTSMSWPVALSSLVDDPYPA